MKTIRLSSMLGMLLFVAACVTINVYFPSAEAVEAADQIIQGVYGEGQEPESQPEKKPQPDSSLQIHLYSSTCLSGWRHLHRRQPISISSHPLSAPSVHRWKRVFQS